MGAEVEILCKIGVVEDYYNLIHRHNINHYYLCKAVSFGEKQLTEEEVKQFHLSTLRLSYEEACQEYENCAVTKVGRLVANRELPVLQQAKKLLDMYAALRYAGQACEAIMACYTPRELPPKGSFFYHQGVFLSGMERVFELTGDRKFSEYLKEYVDYVLGPEGEVYGFCHELGLREESRFAGKELTMLDCKQPVILLYKLYEETGEEKYKKAIQTISESMYYWPVNVYGGYWHMMDQHNQMWMDGAYMCGPLSVKYAKYFGAEVLRERAIHQIFIMNDHIKDPKTGLYFHGWDPTKKAEWADPDTGLSAHIWGRAVGWYAVAILDMMDDLPQDHPALERMKQIEAELLENLVRYQDPVSGLWYQVLDQPGAEGNWVESSCTNLFLYAYAKAIRLGIVSKEQYGPVVEKGFQGIRNRLYYDQNGNLVVDQVCVGTCIETGTYEHYISRSCTQNDLHGMGAFVLMCTEMVKYLGEECFL